MGLIAHPCNIEGIAASHDASLLLTAGGKDMTINIWHIDTTVIDEKEIFGGSDVEPYAKLIEGGKDGEFYQEIVNYFYYSQLRAQGETSTAVREITGFIPLEEIPNIMRALGFYPSEKEVEDMLNEVKYARFTATGDLSTEIGLVDFIKLYVNHRPVFGIGKDQLDEAFHTIKNHLNLGGDLYWKGSTGLSTLLSKFGEALGEDELNACIVALMGEEGVSNRVTSKEYAEKILGFEDYANV
jgi:hypothetical protein